MDMINRIWPQWETVELIGSGSFGKVYKAVREEMGNQYFSAIKVMQIPSDQSEVKDLQRSGMDMGSIRSYYEDMIRNLLNEIQIMESLKSANNIVGIEDHQVVKIADGFGWIIYIRMELLTDLGGYLEQHTMSAEEVAQMGMDLCLALTACEKVNIIHRDIKIDNVFINEFGSFKLGDFGISKQLEKTQSAVSQKGTNMYMAPEVFRGEHYDQTVDIYSLGIMMYRLLNDGRFPFMPPVSQPLQYNDTQRALERRLSGEIMTDPCNADPVLAQIIRKACEYQPEKRFQSAGELQRALQQYRYRQKETEKLVRTVPDLPNITGGQVSGNRQTAPMQDDGTYSVFSANAVSKTKEGQGTGSELPEWTMGTDPAVMAALEVTDELNKRTEQGKEPKWEWQPEQKQPQLQPQPQLQLQLEQTVAAIPKTEEPEPIGKSEKPKPKPERHTEKPERKSRKKVFIGIGAVAVAVGALVFLAVFMGWLKLPFLSSVETTADQSVLSQEVTSVEKLGVSARFPNGWEVMSNEDRASASKRDDANTEITFGIRYPKRDGYEKYDQTDGMSQELAEKLFKNIHYATEDIKESSLYEINGRKYWHVRFAYDGAEQSRFITFEDSQQLEFCLQKDGTITEEDEKLFQEVMRTVQLHLEGIDYSELRPADADEQPFVLNEEQTHAAGLGVSLKLPAVCEVTANEDGKLAAEYSGSTYNGSYSLQITKTDMSAAGYVENGMNDATAQKILTAEESESGRSIEKYLFEDVGGRVYVYMRTRDSGKTYITMATMVNDIQYSYRMVYDYYEYSDYQEVKAFLIEMIGTALYS